MQLCFFCDGLSFQHLLHQINASARTIKLIAQQLIGRTGRGTKTAMYAAPHNVFCFLTFRGIHKKFSKFGVHDDLPVDTHQNSALKNVQRLDEKE
jgi:hypothetical protein